MQMDIMAYLLGPTSSTRALVGALLSMWKCGAKLVLKKGMGLVSHAARGNKTTEQQPVPSGYLT